jgi:chorismate--pyruvate lyase
MNISATRWRARCLCADRRLKSWLTDDGSLTRRIEQRCERFSVTLLRQLDTAPAHDERRMIGVQGSADCVVREVSLNCSDRPVIFAHSVLARKALHGAWRIVGGMGRRPLGAALFSDPRIHRHPLHFRQLRQGDELYYRACNLLHHAPAGLWARRSLFVSHGEPLLVTEVFLPDILELAP